MNTSGASVLDLNDDILFAICQMLSPLPDAYFQDLEGPVLCTPLKALSMTCRRLRYLAAPELFFKIRIETNHWECDRLRATLKSLKQSSPFPQRHTRFCSILISTDPHKPEEVPHRPLDTDLARKLASTLMDLRNLETLKILVPDAEAKLLQDQFQDMAVHMPAVKTLIISIPDLRFLVPLCSNLQVLVCTHLHLVGDSERENMVTSAACLPELRVLELRATWHPKMLRLVLESLAQLRSLSMVNSRPRYKFWKLLPILAKFSELKELSIAKLHYLDIGFNPPMCGNAYRGRNGPALRRSVNRQREELERKIIDATFDSCKRLEVLWIGNQIKATAIRTNDGTIQEKTVITAVRKSWADT